METVQLQLSNRKQSLSKELGSIDQELVAWLKYLQGCRCRYRSNIVDNLDVTHTLIQKVVVPRGVIAINSVKLSAYGHKFRAYESGAAAGGAEYLTSSPSTMSVTTDLGDRAETDLTTPSNTTTSQPTPNVTADESGHSHTLVCNVGTYSAMYIDPSIPRLYSADTQSNEMKAHSYTELGDYYHQHGCDHTHIAQGASHQHAMDHTHQVPGSNHSHNITLPDHIHDLVYAIYEAVSAGAFVGLNIIDPLGSNFDLNAEEGAFDPNGFEANDFWTASFRSGEFFIEDLELKEYFTMIGVYTLAFSADDLARITSIVVCDLVIEPE